MFFRAAMDHIYHGCAYVNAKRSQKLTAENDKFFVPTNRCFWKVNCDVSKRVKTRSMVRSEKVAVLRTINNYFRNNEKEKDNAII